MSSAGVCTAVLRSESAFRRHLVIQHGLQLHTYARGSSPHYWTVPIPPDELLRRRLLLSNRQGGRAAVRRDIHRQTSGTSRPPGFSVLEVKRYCHRHLVACRRRRCRLNSRFLYPRLFYCSATCRRRRWRRHSFQRVYRSKLVAALWRAQRCRSTQRQPGDRRLGRHHAA